jgi:tetratricopeptide (TPR) repeat protein
MTDLGLNYLNMTKMNSMKKAILSTIFFLGAATFVQAQSGWNWPEDKKTAEEKNAIYSDNLKQGNYKEAAKHLHWILKNAPDLNSSIYINGAKIYEGLADNEKDQKQAFIYQDSALWMYDQRIKYFNDEANVLDRKAYAAYKYLKDRNDKIEELFNLYKRAFLMNGNNIMDVNTVAYMDVARRYKTITGKLSDEDILDIYDQLNAILDYKAKTGAAARAEKFRENIDALLTATVKVDCDFVEQNLAPRVKENPKDGKMAKKVFQLLLTGKCTESESFLLAAKALFDSEPTYGLAKVIGVKSKVASDLEGAGKYFQEALNLADDNIKKADMYLELADIAAKRGQKVTARDYALKSVSADASRKEAYTLIGNLYFSSHDDCKGGENIVHDRAVYIAAYEMYKKAGNSQGMATAQAQFPSMEEIFNYGMKLGESVKVGCWINEVVTLQKR